MSDDEKASGDVLQGNDNMEDHSGTGDTVEPFARAKEPKGRMSRIHRQTLAEINKPAFTGRRHAAHSRLIEILRKEIFHSAKEERPKCYTVCLELLEDCLLSTQTTSVGTSWP